MERDEEAPSSANNGCGESDMKSESSSKRRRRSSSCKALSDRTLELLEEKVSFPNVSKCRLKHIKASILVSCFRDAHELPDSLALNKEHKIGSYLDTESPIYSESFADVPKVEVGKHLNVLDLLGDDLLSFSTSSQIVPTSSSTTTRRENINVESTLNLKGKYIMICCVFVPSMWCSDDGPMVYHTALASHELARRDDFVLVVVPMMREGFTHSYSAYQHFLLGFSCLAVPFCDSHRREYICSALGFDGKPKVVILDPSQKVLYHGLPIMFSHFGGAEHDCFPFTPERMEICLRRDGVLQDLSLNELLGLSDTDVLCNILKDAQITIAELKQKFVGLYVCSNCRNLKKLQEVHEECRRQKYEFEIVVICCPFEKQVPPKLHNELIVDALASFKLIGWWVFPFNNTVSHRVIRMREIDSHEEGLFIVDPIEKYVDSYGIQIIRDFGMDGYPFTRRKLIEKEFQRKMGLRLNSLLPWEHVYGMRDALRRWKVGYSSALLKNYIVLLYLFKEKEKFLADKLGAWYKKNMKRKHSNVVVVAVNMDGSCTSDEDFMAKGWFVCRAQPCTSAKLCDEFFHPLCTPRETVVAFGEDGQIQSMDASHLLECRCPPFHGNLREEIARVFDDAGFHYMRHYDCS